MKLVNPTTNTNHRHVKGLLRADIIWVFVCLLFALSAPDASAGTIIQRPSHLGLSRGLVGHWTFDGPNISGTRAKDISGNNKHGTLTGGPTLVAGKVGQGLSFDGVDDFVDIPNTTALDGASRYSLSVWNRRRSPNDFTFLQKGTDLENQTGINFWNDGNVYFIVSNGGFGYASYPLNDTLWHHLVLVYDGSQSGDDTRLKGYVDGQQVALLFYGTIPATSAVHSSNFLVGDRPVGGEFQNGFSDDVRIYDRVLSAGEISRLYRIGLGSTLNRGAAPNPLDRGLVGHWTFDGSDISGTRAKDISGNNNHGTLTGGASLKPVAGKVGQALDFDGVDDYVDVAGAAVSAPPFSMCAWTKLDSLSPDRVIVSMTDNSVTSRRHWILVRSTEINIESRSGGTAGVPSFVTTVEANRWYHVCGVWQATNSRSIYVDGIHRSTNTTTVSVTGINDAEIGRAALSTPGNYTDGLIDDVRIYNRTLSAAEISNLYNQTQSKVNSSQTDSLTKGLVGYWNFDGPNISGTRAKDSSGNNNHGTLTGGASLKPVMGKIGQALEFDGVDDVVQAIDVANIPANHTSQTLSLWAKYPSATDRQILLNLPKDNGCCGGSTVAIELESGALEVSQWGAGTLVDTTAPSVDTWHHIVYTYDGTTHILYVDGINKNTGVVAQTTETPTVVMIGNNVAYPNPYRGLIDDVRIYNRTLSAGEIQKLYNMGK